MFSKINLTLLARPIFGNIFLKNVSKKYLLGLNLPPSASLNGTLVLTYFSLKAYLTLIFRKLSNNAMLECITHVFISKPNAEKTTPYNKKKRYVVFGHA